MSMVRADFQAPASRLEDQSSAVNT